MNHQSLCIQHATIGGKTDMSQSPTWLKIGKSTLLLLADTIWFVPLLRTCLLQKALNAK